MIGKIKRDFVFNIIRHAVFLLVLYIIQAEILPWFGTYAIPPILVIGTVGIAHLEGSFPGAVFGLFAGMLMDSALGRPILTFTVALTLIGILIGWLGENYLSLNMPAYLICCLAALLVCTVLQVFSLLFYSDAGMFSLLFTSLLQIITGLIAALPLYPVSKWLARMANRG